MLSRIKRARKSFCWSSFPFWRNLPADDVHLNTFYKKLVGISSFRILWIRFHKMWVGCTASTVFSFVWVVGLLLCFVGMKWVIWLGFTGFYRVLLGLTGFYWVLMGFRDYYWVSDWEWSNEFGASGRGFLMPEAFSLGKGKFGRARRHCPREFPSRNQPVRRNLPPSPHTDSIKAKTNHQPGRTL